MYCKLFLCGICMLFVTASPVPGQEPARETLITDVTTEAKPWTNLELNNDPSLIRFAIMTDHTGGQRAGVFAEAVAKLNLLQPEFVMSIGDLIEGYEDQPSQIHAQWDRFLPIVSKLEMPFFFVPGNHDNGRPMWSEVYRERFGVECYHFVYRNVLFLTLSTNTGPENNTGISQEQALYAAQVLREHPDVRWTLVFQHKPLWNDEGSKDWARIEALLKGRKCSVFAGHTHNYLGQEKEGISYITLATTGAGSALRGTAYGEFDQVAWVTVTPEGPIVANLLLEGILDKNLRTPETAKELALFGADKAVTATPILNQTSDFTSGTSHLKITNPSQKPLRIRVLTEAEPGLRVEPVSFSTVIPGGSEYSGDVHVSSSQPIPGSSVQPVVLHWNGWYDHPDNAPAVEVGGQRRIPIDSPLEIPHSTQSPIIDGKLEDWANLPFKVNQPGEIWNNTPAWKGPQDGSFDFGVMADDQNLYVGIRTQDDEQCFDGWKNWEDLVVLWVDGRLSDEGDPKQSVFSLITGPEVSPQQAEEFSEGETPQGVASGSQPIPGGFEAEFAIPLSYLKERQGGDWQRVRLNIAFVDFDRRDAREGVTVLNWRPRWTRSNSYPQAGVFRRASDR